MTNKTRHADLNVFRIYMTTPYGDRWVSMPDGRLSLQEAEHRIALYSKRNPSCSFHLSLDDDFYSRRHPNVKASLRKIFDAYLCGWADKEELLGEVFMAYFTA